MTRLAVSCINDSYALELIQHIAVVGHSWWGTQCLNCVHLFKHEHYICLNRGCADDITEAMVVVECCKQQLL